MTNLLTVFLVLILSHLIADFGLQFGSVGTKKRALNKEMLAHIGLIGIFTFFPLLLMNFPLMTSLRSSLIVVLAHLVIDIIKAEHGHRYHVSPLEYRYWPLLGLDQALHITTLYLIITYMLP